MKVLAILLAAALVAGCADSEQPEVDTDGDGYSDAVELEQGSDPRNATSIPAPVAPAPEGNETWPVWGPADSPIRPGASLGGYCSFNFLYESPNGSAYIGTAAHCTSELGERLELPGVGDIATVVYDSDIFSGADGAVDFTLALLDESAVSKANPQMFAYNGPTGSVTTADLAVGDIVEQYGYGLLLGDNEATRARQGVLTDFDDRQYNIDMPAVNGDSGSPILQQSSGKALGIISHYGIGATPPSTDEGPIMPFIFAELAKAGYGDVRVATI